jgi:RNA polymerase sigma-70 factor (ECF subfamily)
MLANGLIATDDFLAGAPTSARQRSSRSPDISETPPPSPALRLIPGGAGLSDEALVERARNGDRSAFSRLVERHQRRLFRLALGIVHNREDAADVVQETFLKIHQSLAGFKGASAFATWSHRIAVNLAIDTRRRSGRTEHVAVHEGMITDEAVQRDLYAPSSASPQKQVFRQELSGKIEQAWAGLSEQHREILRLRELEELSYESIATVLKIPKGTVMSRLFHARQRMQDALRPYLAREPS